MIKIRKLTVAGFRGARFTLPLDFTDEHRSLSVFGENASGKSTITDAIEWSIKDRVDHLWREDCREASLRNVLLNPNDPSEVIIEFSDSSTNTKRLTSDLSITDKSQSAAFHDLVEELRKEHLFLRHAQITEFVQSSKGEKRKAIASIIGYDSITDFRSVIQSTLSALQRDDQYTNAKLRVEEEKSRLLQLAGKLLTSPQHLYEQMNDELKRGGFELTISDKASYRSAVRELRAKTNQEERIAKKLLLDDLSKDIDTLRARIAGLNAKLALISGYNDLVTEKSTIGQIHLKDFLRSGVRVLDGAQISDSSCPFCLTAYDLEKLRAEVEQRLQAIAHVAKKLETESVSVEALLTAISETNTACDKFHRRYDKLEEHRKLCETIDLLSAKIRTSHTMVRDRFSRHETVAIPEDILAELAAIDVLAQKHQATVATQSDALKFTEYENRIILLIERLRELREAFYFYDKNSKIVSSFVTQILSLGTIFDRFLQVQGTALQTVLDKISNDVGELYRRLHPSENVDRVRLRIVGEEGIEFEYYFHGKPTYPPLKYLSESHLNSLGVVLFLASAKLFNRKSRFLVLDDIVTSFDVNHRRRLLRLIKETFVDWQVILLTHEAFWFDIIKKELLPDGWLLKEVVCDPDNGIQIEPSANDMNALIAAKRQKFDVSNDLRKLLEATLKEICCALEVKMAFRYNDQNERRMSGELLSELRATINRKCAELKGHEIFAHLEGSNLIATLGSHDNPETITGGDVDVALGDIAKLKNLFECQRCGRNVEAKNVVPGQNKISCKCGKKEVEWK
jgi:recombinational DNA repair ATPase RecF